MALHTANIVDKIAGTKKDMRVRAKNCQSEPIVDVDPPRGNSFIYIYIYSHHIHFRSCDFM